MCYTICFLLRIVRCRCLDDASDVFVNNALEFTGIVGVIALEHGNVLGPIRSLRYSFVDTFRDVVNVIVRDDWPNTFSQPIDVRTTPHVGTVVPNLKDRPPFASLHGRLIDGAHGPSQCNGLGPFKMDPGHRAVYAAPIIGLACNAFVVEDPIENFCHGGVHAIGFPFFEQFSMSIVYNAVPTDKVSKLEPHMSNTVFKANFTLLSVQKT